MSVGSGGSGSSSGNSTGKRELAIDACTLAVSVHTARRVQSIVDLSAVEISSFSCFCSDARSKSSSGPY